MERVDVKAFRAERAWDSRLLLDLGRHSARIHWTDQPYRWHTNSGEELFVVLDGAVRMHWRRTGGEEGFEDLGAGDVMLFDEGDEHCAEPYPEARVLVVERKDSE